MIIPTEEGCKKRILSLSEQANEVKDKEIKLIAYGRIKELIEILYSDFDGSYNKQWQKQRDVVNIVREIIFSNGNIDELKNVLV